MKALRKIDSLSARPVSIFAGCVLCLIFVSTPCELDAASFKIHEPGLFKSLTEPPCSYVSTEHRKGFVRSDDPAVAWIRGPHNGGAVPVRHFLSGPRIINDTYGLFFYDPNAGFVSVFEKDYGFEFEGWRHGIMMAKGPDGTLYSTLSGLGIEGPKEGQRLKRVPSIMTQWGHWLMLHPESTAYNLFGGDKYPVVPVPETPNSHSITTIQNVDPRLSSENVVMGVELGTGKAYPITTQDERLCFNDSIDGNSLAVFWYGPTQSGVAFDSTVNGRQLTFRADKIAPETAPFMDNETDTRWTLAGRGVDGPLKGTELKWVNSVQCKWYAWSAEYPKTAIFEQN